jgi:hypothetical protein
MATDPQRMKLNKEISLLRRICPLLEKYAALAHGIEAQSACDLFSEWLHEAIAEREALPNLVNILRNEK